MLALILCSVPVLVFLLRATKLLVATLNDRTALLSNRTAPLSNRVAGVALAGVALVTPLLLASPVRAQNAELQHALATIAEGDLEKLTSAVEQIAGSESPRALPILKALETKKLVFDTNQQAFIKTDKETLDALTGKPGAPSGETEVPRINNVVRRALGPAIAQLSLRSKDVAVRLEAATELAKRPSDSLVETIRDAIGKESDADVKTQLKLAVAQIDIDGDDFEKRMAALSVIKSEGDLSHKGALERILSQDKPSQDPKQAESLKFEAAAAMQAIERRAFFISAIANLFYGLSLGSVLLLAALGLAITFGLMNVINMAHGEMLMIGAYSAFVVQNLFASALPGLQDFYLIAAIPVSFGAAAAVGLVLERTVIRFLYGRPLETLLATWGISLLLIQTVRLIFGAQNVTVSNPSWLSGGLELMPTVVLPYSRIATLGFVVVVVGFVWFLLNRTRLGLYLRAVTQNREMAANMGIPTKQIDMWTFALGCGVAGLGGLALSQLGNVGPELGQGFIVDSFMVVVLGGVGNILGTIAGALGLGIVNKFLEPLAGAVLGKIVILIMVILFIQKRPQGLFALKGRAAEM